MERETPLTPTTAPTAQDADDTASRDEPALSEYDKTIADSFPSSDPPAVP